MHVLLSVIAASLIAVGLVGAVVPVLPGIPLIFGALAGELAAGNSILRSTHVGVSAWVGLIFGTLFKLVSSVTMLALFGAGWWWNRSA